MTKFAITQQDSLSNRPTDGTDAAPVPGVVLIFSMGRPCCVAIPLSSSGLELGRGEPSGFLPVDPKMSRRHAAVAFTGQQFRIVDHGSQNGTLVDGVRVSKELLSAGARLLRTGDSIFLLSSDIGSYRKAGVHTAGELVLGPAMQDVMAQAARAARYGNILQITGESGSGKEGLARTFHAQSHNPTGPFVAINCATIAAGLAERLLFGARRGAYSGAVADTDGLIQAADGGTLFLDEIAELDLAVQAKFLRVVETRQVLSLGALKPRTVDLQICSASHRNLRNEMVNGRFREDLYFRISRPEVAVPPLRQRLAEIPWLIERALRSVDPSLVAHGSFVEACLLRHWPGNVRELLAEVRTAGQNALGQDSQRVEAQYLSPTAGLAIAPSSEPPPLAGAQWHPPVGRAAPRPVPDKSQIESALSESGGNISATARLLGLHRTQLKRLMEKYDISAAGADPLVVKDDEA